MFHKETVTLIFVKEQKLTLPFQLRYKKQLHIPKPKKGFIFHLSFSGKCILFHLNFEQLEYILSPVCNVAYKEFSYTVVELKENILYD